MKAYEIKRGTKVQIIDKEVSIPPEANNVIKNDIITIKNLDGMYCNAINEKGETAYITAWTEVKEVDNKSLPLVEGSTKSNVKKNIPESKKAGPPPSIKIK